MNGAKPPLHRTPSWNAQGHLHFIQLHTEIGRNNIANQIEVIQTNQVCTLLIDGDERTDRIYWI